MLTCPTHLPIYFCAQAVDFRKSFDGLTGVIASVFEISVLDGHLFLFINKRRDRIKAMWWDRDGLVLFYKKLEAHYPHFFLFTESGDDANNFACRPASAG